MMDMQLLFGGQLSYDQISPNKPSVLNKPSSVDTEDTKSLSTGQSEDIPSMDALLLQRLEDADPINSWRSNDLAQKKVQKKDIFSSVIDKQPGDASVEMEVNSCVSLINDIKKQKKSFKHNPIPEYPEYDDSPVVNKKKNVPVEDKKAGKKLDRSNHKKYLLNQEMTVNSPIVTSPRRSRSRIKLDVEAKDIVVDTPDPRSQLCDYDKNPTKLYLAIQKNKWDDASRHAIDDPASCSTWVSRKEKKEKGGGLRWCLLPLHAAIVFNAPNETILTLLRMHPLGAKCKDDHGSLPLHLAFRNQCDVFIVYLLILAYPEGLNGLDRKNRVPRAMMESSPDITLKEEYSEAIDKATDYSRLAGIGFKAKILDLEERLEEAIALAQENATDCKGLYIPKSSNGQTKGTPNARLKEMELKVFGEESDKPLFQRVQQLECAFFGHEGSMMDLGLNLRLERVEESIESALAY